jgi:hypothetical protein
LFERFAVRPEFLEIADPVVNPMPHMTMFEKQGTAFTSG